MKRLLVALVLLLIAVPSFAQTPATPGGTTTPAASPTAPIGARVDQQTKEVGGIRIDRPNTFEGGLQVGETSDGASLILFAKAFTCAINPPALAADGATTTARCAQTGLRAGDFVNCRLPVGSASGVMIHGLTAGTNYVDIEFVCIHNDGIFCDLAATSLTCFSAGATAR